MANPRFDVWNLQTNEWQQGSEAHLALFPDVLSRTKPGKGTKTSDAQPPSASTTNQAPATGDNTEKE